jgi:alginate O-acetyltransferase complex protein AlgI
MLFNSLHFILFLPVVFSLYWLMPHRWRWVLLLLASYYFYMSWNPWFGLLLLGTTLIDWYAGLRIHAAKEKKSKRAWLLLSIISNLGILAVFKYSIFFYNTGVDISNAALDTTYQTLEYWLIPVGLSFYTFQSLSYSIDVYRGEKPEPNATRFALFVSFFPQLVAGPVERFSHLMPQLTREHYLSAEMLVAGARLAIWGFFKKIAIADRLATFVDPVFADPAAFSGLALLITGIFFTLQIYCDFSGYSDIARGVAKLFGFDLMINFRRPLLATSVRDFWKRWHISMTSWFRDYLYVPLGGNRTSKERWLLNLLLVFLISGLWHGARWTFVIWGAMHGILYIIEALAGRKRSYGIAGWLYTFLFVSVAFIAFRAPSVEELGIVYDKIFSPDYNIGIAFSELRRLNDLFPLLLVLVGLVFLFAKEITEEHGSFGRLRGYERMRPVFYITIFIMLFVIGEFSANEFIYFNF